MSRSAAFSNILGLLVLLLGAACAASVPSGGTAELPATVEEAVVILKDWLSQEDRDWILRNPRDEVTATLHLPFGTGVRNSFRLWGGNPELLASCGTDDAEECSGVLFERLWEAVREEADPGLVRELDCQFALIEEIQVEYRGFRDLRVGELLGSLQEQIDRALPEVGTRLTAGCSAERLVLRPTGDPDLECFVRAEFSEDGRDPVSLGTLFGWISWRNGFRVFHAPPEVAVRFETACSWPERPVWFGSALELLQLPVQQRCVYGCGKLPAW